METDRYLYIKHMVCDRCIMAVTKVLERLGLTPVSVVLGRAELAETPTKDQKEKIRKSLEALGFELIGDPRTRIVEQVKNLIIEWVHRPGHRPRTNLSQYLAAECHHDYSTLSKLFSETQGTTIEKYCIAQKIERAKELLVRTIARRDCRPPGLLQPRPPQCAVQNPHRTHAQAIQTTEKSAAHPAGQSLKAGLQHPQTPNIIAGCMPKIRHNKRAIFNVGSDRPDT